MQIIESTILREGEVNALAGAILFRLVQLDTILGKRDPVAYVESRNNWEIERRNLGNAARALGML